MTKFMFGLVFIALIVLYSGCGDARTTAHLRSPEEIQTVTDGFVAGKTTLQDVYDALGPWNSNSRDVADINESVVYWTNDGKQTSVNFTVFCDDGTNGCIVGGAIDYSKDSHMLFTGATR